MSSEKSVEIRPKTMEVSAREVGYETDVAR